MEPPAGNTGGKQGDHLEVGLHWATLTGPGNLSDEALAVLDRWFGSERESIGGGAWYLAGWKWAAGPTLRVEHVNAKKGVDSCMIDLDGSTLDLLTPDERIELLRDLLRCSFCATRLDVAIDEKGGLWRFLQSQMRASFVNGEVCGFRVCEKHDSLTLGGAEACTTVLGRRGKLGSGKQVCVYDKGLESGATVEAGEWTRWETRFYGDCAAEVAIAITWTAEFGCWPEEAARRALGVVEFREVTPGETAVERRAPLPWWQKITDGLDLVRVVARRRLASLGGRRKWVEEQVLPGFARMMGVAEFDPRRHAQKLGKLLRQMGVGVVEAGRFDRVALEFDRFINPTWSDRVAEFVLDEVAAWRAERVGEAFALERAANRRQVE